MFTTAWALRAQCLFRADTFALQCGIYDFFAESIYVDIYRNIYVQATYLETEDQGGSGSLHGERKISGGAAKFRAEMAEKSSHSPLWFLGQ
jgi:hypothetical protein